MLLIFISTDNKAVYSLWMHRNNVYTIVMLKQLFRLVVHKGISIFRKFKRIIFRLL